MKKCPYCAEEIQDEAIVCRYCGRDLAAPAHAGKPAPAAVLELDDLKEERARREKERDAAVSQRGLATAGIVVGILIGFAWNWIFGGLLGLAGLLALATQINKIREMNEAIGILDQKIKSRKAEIAHQE